MVYDGPSYRLWRANAEDLINIVLFGEVSYLVMIGSQRKYEVTRYHGYLWRIIDNLGCVVSYHKRIGEIEKMVDKSNRETDPLNLLVWKNILPHEISFYKFIKESIGFFESRTNVVNGDKVRIDKLSVLAREDTWNELTNGGAR